MGKLSFALCLCLCVAPWSGLPAWSSQASGQARPDLMTLLRRVESRYNNLRTLEVNFEQQYRVPGRAARTETGVLSLRKPGRMRWEYQSPEGKLFITDGKTVWFYSPAAGRAEKSKLKESGDLRTPLAFLIGKLDFQRDFSTFRSRPEADGLLVSATPKSKNAPYTEVGFTVTSDARIAAVRVVGVDQSEMLFRLHGEKVNPSIRDSAFRFELPAGVELVEMGEEDGEVR